MASAGNALPEHPSQCLVVILGPCEGLIACDKAPRELMVTIFALIGETFLQPSRQPLSASALGLGEAMSRMTEFVGMRNLLARRERQEVQKAGINAYSSGANHRNTVGARVDAQAQIPARGPLDDTATLQPSSRDGLLVEAHRADAWHMDACAVRRFERIRKGNAAEAIALAFELGLLGQLLVAALPGKPGCIQHALQRMAGNAELFAVIGQQIVKGFLAVIDTVFGILFDFSDSPIPDPGKLEQPGIQLLCLRGIEVELELALDHATPVSGFRCTA